MEKINLTWQWIAGFIQAEGYLRTDRIVIGQKDRESLDLIRDFLVENLSPNEIPKVGGPYKNGENIIYSFGLFSQKTYAKLLVHILPYLYDKKQIINSAHLPLDNEWIGGFWEGDGHIRSYQVSPSYTCIQVSFTQKDVQTLKLIQAYLKTGHVYDKHYQLKINENSNNYPITQLLLLHVKTSRRYTQIVECLNNPKNIVVATRNYNKEYARRRIRHLDVARQQFRAINNVQLK